MEIDKNPEVKKPGHALWTGKQASCLPAEMGTCVFLIHICDCPKAVLAGHCLRACPYSPSVYTMGHVPVLIPLFQTCWRFLRGLPFEAALGTLYSPALARHLCQSSGTGFGLQGGSFCTGCCLLATAVQCAQPIVSAWVSPVTFP